MTTLEDVYAKLPSVACKGLCWNSCGPIDMSNTERQRITDLGATIPPFSQQRSQEWAAGAKHYCPALKFGARPDGGIGCSVYEARPFICRVWGVGEGDLACPHGCETDGRLNPEEVMALLMESYQAGGHDDLAEDDPEFLRELMADPQIGPLMKRLMNGDRTVEPRLKSLILKLRERE